MGGALLVARELLSAEKPTSAITPRDDTVHGPRRRVTRPREPLDVTFERALTQPRS